MHIDNIFNIDVFVNYRKHFLPILKVGGKAFSPNLVYNINIRLHFSVYFVVYNIVFNIICFLVFVGVW